jgi:hypothetical protein
MQPETIEIQRNHPSFSLKSQNQGHLKSRNYNPALRRLESLREMSPQEQNRLETATATVISRSRGRSIHKNTTGLKADGFRFGKILSN